MDLDQAHAPLIICMHCATVRRHLFTDTLLSTHAHGTEMNLSLISIMHHVCPFKWDTRRCIGVSSDYHMACIGRCTHSRLWCDSATDRWPDCRSFKTRVHIWSTCHHGSRSTFRHQSARGTVPEPTPILSLPTQQGIVCSVLRTAARHNNSTRPYRSKPPTLSIYASRPQEAGLHAYGGGTLDASLANMHPWPFHSCSTVHSRTCCTCWIHYGHLLDASTSY
jgi:hypothetical protein